MKVFILLLLSFIEILVNLTSLNAKELVINSKELEVKIGLALSGGGSRGIAQIGVLRAFEKEGLPIHFIAGTSIGAFVGGLYAVGYTPDELEEIVMTTDWENVLTVLKEQERVELFLDQKLIQDRTLATLRFQNFKFVYPQALSLGWKFNSFIQKLIWNGAYYSDNFDNLKIPFRAVATNVIDGRTIILKEGNLIRAMKASSAIPLLNTPVNLDTMLLVDGGLFANIPVEEVAEFKPHIVIALNTTSPLPEREELLKPWTLASQIITIYMNKYVAESLEKADFIITPEIGNHPNDNFEGLDSLIRKGEESAQNILRINIRKKIEQIKDSIVKAKVINVKKEFGFLSEKIFLKKTSLEKSSINKEYYILTNNPTDSTLEDFLLHLDNQSVGNLKFFEAEKEIILEVEKYPLIKEIIIETELPNLKRIADSLSTQFIKKYDNPSVRQLLIEKIKKVFARNGYSFAKISIYPDSFSERLTIKIKPNKIGKIILDKNIKTSDYIVQREIPLEEGDYTNAEKLVQSWNNLVSTDLFNEVFIDFQIDTNNAICNIFVSAKERGTQVVNILLRIDNEKNLQGGTDLIQENLLNSGTRFLFSLTGCRTDLLAKINLSQPRIWKTNYTLSLESFYFYQIIPIFVKKSPLPINKFENYVEKEITTERLNFNITAGKQIERLGNLVFSIKFEKQRYYEQNEPQIPKFYNINNFLIGFVYDTRDKVEFTTSGRYLNLFFESPLFKATNSTAFTKAMFIHTTNYSIKSFVVRPSLLFGFADNNLPFPDLFSLGGDGNFIGYRQNEFLGRQVFNGSVTLQYNLPFKVYFDTYLLLTYNIGSVWSQFEAIRISELKHGLGVSIGLDTPIGPVRFTAGNGFYFIKNPNVTVWGPLHFYFSIGNKLF